MRVRRRLAAVLAIALGSMAAAARGGVVHVPADVPTIQGAIDLATPGTEILVAPGTYEEFIDLRGKALELRSSDGAAATIIDASGTAMPVVRLDSGEGLATVIEGFTLRGGENQFGGGVTIIGSDPTIVGCVIRDNAADAGGAVYAMDGDPILVNCVLTANIANAGGGVATDGGSLVAVNCTIAGNSARFEAFGGALAAFDGTPTLFNCIAWANGALEITQEGAALVTVSHGIVQGGWKGAGFATTGADPAFVDLGSGDLRVRAFSPAIDAGFAAAVPPSVVVDLDGLPRFVDDPNVADTGESAGAGMPIVDLGAFERQTPSVHVPDLYDTIQQAVIEAGDGQVVLVGPGVYMETIDLLGRPITLQATMGPGATVIDGSGSAGSVLRAVSGEGPQTVVEGFALTGGSGTVVEVAEGIVERRGGGILVDGAAPRFVGCTIVGNGDGAVLGGGAFVGAGTPAFEGCVFDGNVASRGGGILVRGGGPELVGCAFVSNVAAEDGGGACAESGAAVVLLGCTFATNDAATLGGGVAVLESSVVLTDGRFTANTASRGGGVAFDGGGTPSVVHRNGFFGNHAGFGGGMLCRNAPMELVNLVFSGNAADSDGGALLIEDAAVDVVNTTLAANVAGGKGGGIADIAGSSIVSCIVWGNAAQSSPQVSGVKRTVIAASNVQASGGSGPGWGGRTGSDGGGNIDVDPAFVDPDGADDMIGTGDDDLRPGPSAVLDAGAPDGLPAGVELDYLGGPRRLDGDLDGEARVDMGAYEVDPAVTPLVVNQTAMSFHRSIATAIGSATAGDVLVASPPAFTAAPDIDFAGKAITLRGSGNIVQPAGGTYLLANDAALVTGFGGPTIELAGSLRVPASVTSDVATSSLVTAATAEIVAEALSTLVVDAPDGTVLGGTTTLETDATLAAVHGIASAGAMQLGDGATLIGSLAGEGTVAMDHASIVGDVAVAPAGSLGGSGAIFGNLQSDGTVIVSGGMLVKGDLDGRGTVTVATDVLEVRGLVTGSLAIDGAIEEGGGEPPGAAAIGLRVVGAIGLEPAGALRFPDARSRVEVEGEFAPAVDANERFDLAGAELVVAPPSPDAAGFVEVMSEDIGALRLGLDRGAPGRFPLGTLRIAAAGGDGDDPAPVVLRDELDNATADDGMPEAVYVRTLIIEAGATLVSGGLRVYYEHLANDGIIESPADVIPIPPCPADIDGTGAVDVDDLIGVILAWGATGPDLRADVDGSGVVDVDDLVAVVLSWGLCGSS